MKSWILFGSFALSALGSFESYYYANRPEESDLVNGLWCVLTTDGKFETREFTTQRDPAGFDSTRAQMSYYHSAAHQNHKKLQSL